MSNPLLDDLQAENHEHLLAAGNLGPKRKSSEWTGEKSWTSLGYTAKISRLICACGKKHDTLIGLFHDESSPSGATRSLAVKPSDIPKGEKHGVLVHTSSVAVCPGCLSFLGFLEIPK